MSRILVTGATGFIGSRLCQRLESEAMDYRRVLRQAELQRQGDVLINEMTPETQWDTALVGIQSVIHLAARVHQVRDAGYGSIADYRRINTDAVTHLAASAARAGVARFIFISSIKVNGERTQPGAPFAGDDRPMPVDAYAVSKSEAEVALRKIAADTGMQVTIIRPPLVYGPGVKANFLRMMRWVYKGIPSPLGHVDNRRSLVALDNLVDLIVTCLDHPAAANQTFLVSDDEDISTTELLQRMGVALGKPARLLPVPVWLLKAGAALTGRRDVGQRLLGSLQVDITKTKELLGWKPIITVDEALRQTAEEFLSKQYK